MPAARASATALSPLLCSTPVVGGPGGSELIEEFCQRCTWLSTATSTNIYQISLNSFNVQSLLAVQTVHQFKQRALLPESGAPMLSAAVVFSASDAGPKNFENMSGRQLTRDSWNVA